MTRTDRDRKVLTCSGGGLNAPPSPPARDDWTSPRGDTGDHATNADEQPFRASRRWNGSASGRRSAPAGHEGAP